MNGHWTPLACTKFFFVVVVVVVFGFFLFFTVFVLYNYYCISVVNKERFKGKRKQKKASFDSAICCMLSVTQGNSGERSIKMFYLSQMIQQC